MWVWMFGIPSRLKHLMDHIPRRRIELKILHKDTSRPRIKHRLLYLLWDQNNHTFSRKLNCLFYN